MAVSNFESSTNKTPIDGRCDAPNFVKEALALKTLVEQTQVMILIFQDCQICYANPRSEILTGYSQNELLGNIDLRSQLQLDRISQRLESKAAIQNQEIKLLTKNDRECWLDCSFKVIQLDNHPAISMTAVDITKYKQAEQKIQQVLEQQKKQVSMVSHELRTPLNIISFSSNLLRTYSDRWKPAKVKNYLERVLRGVDTLSLLVDEWLILGNVDTGKLKFEPQPLHLEQFCRNLLSDLQVSDDRNPRQINFYNQANNSWVNLDRRILQLILTNLLENAIKYSPGDKAIDFTVVSDSKETIFKIKDRGIGINNSDLKQLFEPFYRGANVDDIPGTGLGLAVVKKLVKLGGGQISVASQLGKGTEFAISFPQKEALP